MTPINTHKIYVSLVGSDSADGLNIISPVLTFKKAADLAKDYFAAGGSLNVEILIRGGTYKILGNDAHPVFYLNSSYSAPVGKTLTFKPYNNEEVVVAGSEEIPINSFSAITSADPMWSRLSAAAKQNVKVASLPQGVYDLGPGIPPQWHGGGVGGLYGNSQDFPTIPDLIFNDQIMIVARWPNKNSFHTSGFTFGECAQVASVLDSGTSGVFCVESSNLLSSYTIDPKCICGNPDQYPSYPLDPLTGLPPNETCFKNAVFTYPPEYDAVVNNWTAAAVADGIWLHGFWRWDWADETYKVKAINTQNRTIEVESKRSQYGLTAQSVCVGPLPPSAAPTPNWAGDFNANSSPRRWFALNVVEELDTPGEYYIDRVNRKLYFWPPQTITSSSKIRLTHRAVAGPGPKSDGAFEIGFNPISGQPDRNCSECFPYKGWEDIAEGWYQPGGEGQSRTVFNTRHTLKSLFKFSEVNNINLEGLIFQDSAGSGIELNLCNDVLIKQCEVRNIRKDGIAAMGGKNITIDNCELSDIGRHAIINTGGDRRNLLPANKIVTRCSIKRWNRNKLSQSIAILMDGCGNEASYNLIAEGSTGISCSGNNHHIHHNHFHKVQNDSTDMGVIYSGRNISWFGILIENNLFSNCKLRPAEEGGLPGGWYVVSDGSGDRCQYGLSHGQQAIYFDDLQSESTIRKNIFYDCYYGIFLNGGVQHKVENNLFIDSGRPYGAAISSKQYWDQHLQSTRTAILNPEDWPWHETGGPAPFGGRTAVTGYGPYNHPWITGYGGFSWYYGPTWAGVMPVVDITAPAYTNHPKASHLSQMLSIDVNTKTATCTANPNVYKNFANKNILVALREQSSPMFLGRNGVSGTNTYFQNTNTFDVADEITINDLFTVQEKQNLNFKLTNQKLTTIRTAVPAFEDIDFDNIPTISYATGPSDPNEGLALLQTDVVEKDLAFNAELALDPMAVNIEAIECVADALSVIALDPALTSPNSLAGTLSVSGDVDIEFIPAPPLFALDFTNSNIAAVERSFSESADEFLARKNNIGYDEGVLDANTNPAIDLSRLGKVPAFPRKKPTN